MPSPGEEAGKAAPSAAPDISLRLHILSPSSEVPPGFSYPSLSVSTTVGELKRKLQNELLSKPGLDRQRLIHRGRVLANDNDTLLEVFGQQAINEPTAHTLHLVLRPPYGSATAAPIPAVSPAPNPPIQPTPEPVGSSAPTPSSRQYINGSGPREPPHAFPSGTDARNLQQWQALLQSQLAENHLRLHQANVDQHLNPAPSPLDTSTTSMSSSPGANIAPGEQGSRPESNSGGLPTAAAAQHFQHFVSQAQRRRAAAGLNGIGNQTLDQATAGQAVQVPRPEAGSLPENTPPQGQPPQQPLSGHRATFSREVHGPNGQMYQVTVNHNSMTVPGIPGSTGPPTSSVGGQTFPTNIEALRARIQANHNALLNTNSVSRGAPTIGAPEVPDNVTSNPQFLARCAELRARLERIVAELNDGNTPDNEVVASAYSEMDRLEAMRSSAMQGQASRSPAAPVDGSRLASAVPLNASSTNISSPPADPSTTSSVYILSSPTGPYALLVGPSGTHVTARHPILGPLNLPNLPFPFQPPVLNIPLFQPQFPVHYQRFGPVPQQPLQHAAFPYANNNHAAFAPAQPHQHQPAAAQPMAAAQPANPPQAPAENRPNDLLRQLLPLGTHLWLALRLLAFLFFFTNTSSWRRTLLIVLSGLVIFLFQTPLFAGLQEALWGPVRRHLEGLLPEPNPVQAPAAAGATTPEALAAQLVRERDARQAGWLRERVRRVERAVLLLLASLIPGVGERQIAAREEAEQAAARAAEASAAAESGAPRGDASAGVENDDDERVSRRLTRAANEEAARAYREGNRDRMREIVHADEERVTQRVRRLRERGESEGYRVPGGNGGTGEGIGGGSSRATAGNAGTSASAATGRDDQSGEGGMRHRHADQGQASGQGQGQGQPAGAQLIDI